MALTVKNPLTGKDWKAADALWSIWYYAIESVKVSVEARELARAAAAKADLSDAELDEIERRTRAAVEAALADAQDDNG
jgi:hypothetical protein